MSDPNVNIKITTAADTSGAEKATGALKQVKGAGQTAEQANAKAAAAIGQLQNAAAGGASGITQVTGAVRALGAAFLANPIGLGVAAFFLLKDAAWQAGEMLGDFLTKAQAPGLDTGAARAKRMAEQLARIKESGDKALVKVSADAKTAADDLARFVTGLDEAKGRLDALADAGTAAKLAEIDLAEAQAKAGATTETERAEIGARAGAERRQVRTEATAATEARAAMAESERHATATDAVVAAEARLSIARFADKDAADALAAQLERNKTLRAGTPEGSGALETTAYLRERAKAAAATRAAAEAAEAPGIAAARKQVQAAETAQAVQKQRLRTTSAGQQVEQINATAADTQALTEARSADARAAALAAAGSQASTFATGAQAIARSAANDPALREAAKAVNDAAQAAQTDGTTAEEIADLIAAGTALAKELATRNQESAVLKAGLKMLSEQLKNARTQ